MKSTKEELDQWFESEENVARLLRTAFPVKNESHSVPALPPITEDCPPLPKIWDMVRDSEKVQCLEEPYRSHLIAAMPRDLLERVPQDLRLASQDSHPCARCSREFRIAQRNCDTLPSKAQPSLTPVSPSPSLAPEAGFPVPLPQRYEGYGEMPSIYRAAASTPGGLAVSEREIPGGKVLFSVQPETNEAWIRFDSRDESYKGALVWLGLERVKPEDTQKPQGAGYFAVAYPYPGREEFIHGEVRLKMQAVIDKAEPIPAEPVVHDAAEVSGEAWWPLLVASAQRAEGEAARGAWLEFLRGQAQREDLPREFQERLKGLEKTLQEEWRGGEKGELGVLSLIGLL